jgi:uncharacterized protein (TIGR03437 family)
VNQDGTINGLQNPAAHGSFVSLYITGAGQTSPPSVEGDVAVSIDPRPVAPTYVYLLHNYALEVLYAGPSPGLVNSVIQINVRLPDVLPTDPQFTPDSFPIYIQSPSQPIPDNLRVRIALK